MRAPRNPFACGSRFRSATVRAALLPVALWVTVAAVAGLPGLPGLRGGGTAWAAPPKAPFAAAVLPFEDRRHRDGPTWLGRYLAERIDRALVRAPQAAVLPPEAALAWALKMGLRVAVPATPQQLDAMGVSVLVQGTTHEVLGLTELTVHVRTASGDRVPAGAGRFRVNLNADGPAVVLGRVLGLVGAALLPGAPPREPRPPADWGDVERLYALLGEPIVPGDRAARPGLVSRLRPWVTHPTLGGRVHEALAALLMEQALLYLPEGAGRQRLLGEALQHATVALTADPQDTRRQALKAELHVFLRQFYEAKTEASVARIRNPLESLAFVVLALNAGLSTGEANEQLGRALAMDPFLRAGARPQGMPPFQGGVLEDTFQRWDALRKGHAVARRNDETELLEKAIADFNARRFDAAEPLFRRLAEREEDDVTPWIYLNRILIETGQAADAVPGLRRLAEGNPQDADVLHFLGVALAESGNPAQAADAFRKALAERPDDARSQLGLGSAEMAQAHWPLALNALRAALHAQPEDADAWLKLGIVHLRMENWAAAESALQQALSLRPELEEARTYLAEARKHLDG